MASTSRQENTDKPINLGHNFGLEFFEDPNITVEPIPVDDDEEYKRYALTIYERIRSIEKTKYNHCS